MKSSRPMPDLQEGVDCSPLPGQGCRNADAPDALLSQQDCEALAGFAKALAHPARVRILNHVMANQGCLCGDLVALLGLAQSTVSQHVAALCDAGLISASPEGRKRCLCLAPVGLRRLRVLLAML